MDTHVPGTCPDAWYWRFTVAGQVGIGLRSLAVASKDEQLRPANTRFMVPVVFEAPAGA